MLDIIAQIDVLGLGFLFGTLLFLAGLIRVLVDNRSFEDLNRAYRAAAEPPSPVATRAASSAPSVTVSAVRAAPAVAASSAPSVTVSAVSAEAENSPDPDRGSPVRPPRPRRAA